jgi:hypothetical protein
MKNNSKNQKVKPRVTPTQKVKPRIKPTPTRTVTPTPTQTQTVTPTNTPTPSSTVIPVIVEIYEHNLFYSDNCEKSCNLQFEGFL